MPEAAPGLQARWDALRSSLRAQREGPPIEPVSPNRPVPASFAQQRLWFLEQLAEGSPQHNLAVVCRLSGALDAAAMERAFDEMVRRHAILRTTLVWQDERLLQKVHPAAPFTLAVDTVETPGAQEREAAAHRLAAQEAAARFDLSQPPLLRARLLRLAAAEHWLVLTVHHLAFDGWSFEVFMAELATLYQAFTHTPALPAPLPLPRLQYADFAAWQQRWLDAATLAAQLAHWKRELAGPLPVLQLPADRARMHRGPREGASLRFELSTALTDALKALAADAGVTAFTLLLTAFKIFLHRYSGEEDLIVGTPIAQRSSPELAAMIGPLLNTLALRSDLSGEPTFRALLARVDATALRALSHQDLPFEQLVEALGLPRRSDALPLVQVMFAFQNLPGSGWQFPGLDCEAWSLHSGGAPFEVTLYMWDKQGAFGGEWVYDTGLFNASTARQWLESFQCLLQDIAARPDMSIHRLSILPPTTWQTLRQWNATGSAYPRDERVHTVFAALALRTPHATALVRGAQRISYATLDQRADALATALRGTGVGPGSLVALRLAPGTGFIAAALAVLKAGAAYMPVAIDEPVARLRAALAGVTVQMLITQHVPPDRPSPAHAPPHHDPLAAALQAPWLRIDEEGRVLHHAPGRAAPGAWIDASVACVMFTSGSSGAPKGVCTTHRGLLRLVRGQNYAQLGPDTVMLQLAPVAFDAASFEIWGALLNGATLAFADADRPSLADIAAALQTHCVDTLWLSSGLFELMVERHLLSLRGLRQLLTGGDVMSLTHARRFMAAMPGCALINCYGPTENSTFTTFCRLAPALLSEADSVPIGRPVSNSQVWVMDAWGQPLPIGVPGEAWLGGDGVMMGWLGKEGAQAAADPEGHARLVPDPFSETPGARLYRSGDRVRLRSDGELEFTGRMDRQIKLHGFRVEPGEVERVLASCPLLRQAAVIVDTDTTGRKRLIAHGVAHAHRPEAPALIQALQAHVDSLLPPSHRPAAYVLHEALPLDRNGKIDRARLSAHRPDAPTTVPACADDAHTSEAAPQAKDDLTAQIAAVYARVLGLPRVGDHDSFFDLGGHSLLALRLLSEIESALSRKIALVLLFRHPTAAGLASALRQDAAGPSEPQAATQAVALRSGPAGPALFFVPGGRGGMAEMTLYARLLAHADLPLAAWGLPAPGLDGRVSSQASVEAMARDHLATLRELQPTGPWLIAGECIGGAIAYEMARQLRASGEQAALLLLDSWCPTDAGARHYWQVERPRTLAYERLVLLRAAAVDLLSVLRSHARQRPPFGVKRWLLHGYHVAATLRRIGAAWAKKIAHPEHTTGPGAQAASEAARNYLAQALSYRPQPADIPAVLLLTRRNRRLGMQHDWQRLLPELQLRDVPGNHQSYLRDFPEAVAREFTASVVAMQRTRS
ncbi:MAG: amino acid adenylation domain-containing protein [Burkholderiaceae bacterium]|nr:amino acid adenylation domain-containing protein [Burkholderiaceae bacterium]